MTLLPKSISLHIIDELLLFRDTPWWENDSNRNTFLGITLKIIKLFKNGSNSVKELQQTTCMVYKIFVFTVVKTNFVAFLMVSFRCYVSLFGVF